MGLEALAGIGWVDVTALGSIVGPNGLPLGRQSRCRLAPSNPLKAKVDGWGWKLWQALVGLTSPVSTHPKRQNPSRIQAQRVATWSAEPVPFSTFEPAKSIKGGWVGLEALAGIGWVDVAGEHASETAEPQQDSGPTGCHLVGRAGAV